MNYAINVRIYGFDLIFKTDDRCFSPRSVDKGTLAMLSVLSLSFGQRVLDLGCGYGVVGIACAKVAGQENVIMTDISSSALELAKLNIIANEVPNIKIVKSDGFRELDETRFDVILCNPPYHSDFSVAKHFIEKGFNRLSIGGRMFMVTKRREWYKQKLIHIFGGVKITPIDGYFVFEAIKKQTQYATQTNQNVGKPT